MLTASVVPMERVALASQPVAGTVCFSKNAFCGGDGTVQEFIWKNAALLCDGELQEPPSAASAAAAIPAMAQRGGAVAQRGEADFPSARQEVVAAVAAEEEAVAAYERKVTAWINAKSNDKDRRWGFEEEDEKWVQPSSDTGEKMRVSRIIVAIWAAFPTRFQR